MNYVGHHEVARSVFPDASREFLAGSVLPDLARMSGRRIHAGKKANNPLVQDGVDFHFATNTAFDSHPVTKELHTKIEEALKEILGNERWVSRQGANVMKDLFIDGRFFRDQRTITEFEQTLVAIIDGSVDVSGQTEPTDALIGIAETLLENGVPDYSNPEVVARRTQVVLSRTRTPFPDEIMEEIIDGVQAFGPVMEFMGPAVVAETVESLRYQHFNDQHFNDQHL